MKVCSLKREIQAGKIAHFGEELAEFNPQYLFRPGGAGLQSHY